MFSICRCSRRLLAALFLVSFVPATAFAQDGSLKSLTIPTYAASAAAAADWASTYHALKYYRVQEQNPLLRPFQHNPGGMVSLGAMIDAGGFSAWNLTVGRKNPKMAAAGLWAMAAFRTYLAIHNMRNTTKAERR
jgi:hypothetical protein